MVIMKLYCILEFSYEDALPHPLLRRTGSLGSVLTILGRCVNRLGNNQQENLTWRV